MTNQAYPRSFDPELTPQQQARRKVLTVIMWLVTLAAVGGAVYLVGAWIQNPLASDDIAAVPVLTLLSFGVLVVSFIAIILAFAVRHAPARWIATAVSVLAFVSGVALIIFG